MAEDLPISDSFWQNQRLRIFILALFFGGIFLFALGGGLLLFKGGQNDEIQIIATTEDTGDKTEMVVHIDGAVAKPGVYRLASGARVTDAVSAAGGVTAEADRSKINLAAKVADGQKIYIPASGEVTSDKGQVTSQNTSLININTASQSQLESLPAIGSVTAQKIIASRPYSSLEDLLTKKVVSGSTFTKIKDLIGL